jgi:hypothetical protein
MLRSQNINPSRIILPFPTPASDPAPSLADTSSSFGRHFSPRFSPLPTRASSVSGFSSADVGHDSSLWVKLIQVVLPQYSPRNGASSPSLSLLDVSSTESTISTSSFDPRGSGKFHGQQIMAIRYATAIDLFQFGNQAFADMKDRFLLEQARASDLQRQWVKNLSPSSKLLISYGSQTRWTQRSMRISCWCQQLCNFITFFFFELCNYPSFCSFKLARASCLCTRNQDSREGSSAQGGDQM